MVKPRIVGIVHARGGSKRVPLKNIKPLAGLPLVAWIVKAAKRSRLLDGLIISSDHPEIIRIAEEHGAEAPFVRPAELAEDVPSERVTQHAVEFLERRDGRRIDIAVTFQPTTPFCTTEDIDACIELLLKNPDVGSTFTAGPIHERPEWMFRVQGGRAELLMGGSLNGERNVSQNFPKLFIPNGAAYATRREVLFGENSLFAEKMALHTMPFERSVDIDEPIDFVLAEVLARETARA